MNMLEMDMANVKIVTTSSPFPVDRRPIYVMAQHNINYNSDEQKIIELVKDIDNIIDNYDGRGLIHTGNYAMTHNIVGYSRHGDKMLWHTPLNRTAQLEYYKSPAGKHKILVSPSMTEGIDLPYELCQFQIVAKMPFANLADPIWRARMENNPRRAEFAYTGNAISSIVQACGRGMRAIDDQCDTWILDSSFDRVRMMNSYRFPEYFLDALRLT